MSCEDAEFLRAVVQCLMVLFNFLSYSELLR